MMFRICLLFFIVTAVIAGLGFAQHLTLSNDSIVPGLQSNPNPQARCSVEVDHCEPLIHGDKTKCFGANLPYTHTSVVFAADSANQSEVMEKLVLWSGLRNVPKCWEVIQPLLCATYLPKCSSKKDGNETKNVIELIGRELCERTREPCKIVQTTSGWPRFLQCNSSHFHPQCVVSVQ